MNTGGSDPSLAGNRGLVAGCGQAGMSATDARSFSTVETLKDGRQVTVRAIRPDDKGRLAAAFDKLEPTTIYTRFFSHRSELSDEDLRRATEVDFVNTVALVVTAPDDEGEETIVGAGRYVQHPPPNTERAAEVAFTVEEDYQGQGIAGRVLKHLAAIARQQGLARFTAEVLPGNRAMLAVFSRSGLPLQREAGDGVEHVTLLFYERGARG